MCSNLFLMSIRTLMSLLIWKCTFKFHIEFGEQKWAVAISGWWFLSCLMSVIRQDHDENLKKEEDLNWPEGFRKHSSEAVQFWHGRRDMKFPWRKRDLLICDQSSLPYITQMEQRRMKRRQCPMVCCMFMVWGLPSGALSLKRWQEICLWDPPQP